MWQTLLFALLGISKLIALCSEPLDFCASLATLTYARDIERINQRWEILSDLCPFSRGTVPITGTSKLHHIPYRILVR